jgi:hypothetical protein
LPCSAVMTSASSSLRALSSSRNENSTDVRLAQRGVAPAGERPRGSSNGQRDVVAVGQRDLPAHRAGGGS